MPRALTLHRSIIPAGDRSRHLQSLRAKRDHYTGMKCRYWVFEEAAVRGAFVEFVEADSAELLAAAHAGASDPPLDAARIYLEVEIA